MHTYKKSEPQLWTVGYFNPDNHDMWTPLADFGNEIQAATYVNFLNGGQQNLELIKEMLGK